MSSEGDVDLLLWAKGVRCDILALVLWFWVRLCGIDGVSLAEFQESVEVEERLTNACLNAAAMDASTKEHWGYIV